MATRSIGIPLIIVSLYCSSVRCILHLCHFYTVCSAEENTDLVSWLASHNITEQVFIGHFGVGRGSYRVLLDNANQNSSYAHDLDDSEVRQNMCVAMDPASGSWIGNFCFTSRPAVCVSGTFTIDMGLQYEFGSLHSPSNCHFCVWFVLL